MTRITINTATGKQWAQQDFATREEAQKWAFNESQQKYWDKTFVVIYEDFADKVPPTQEEQDALKQKGADQDAARSRLKAAIEVINSDKVLSQETKNVLLDLITVSL